MRQRTLWLLLAVMGIVILGICAITLLLAGTPTDQEPSPVSEQPRAASDRASSLIAGVILTGAAQEYGWRESHLQNSPYAEITLNGQLVMVFDQLNDGQNPGIPLASVIETMIERGAQVIFISTGYRPVPDELHLAEQFSHTPLIMNRADRTSVEWLLPAFAQATHSSAPTTTSTNATSAETSTTASASTASDEKSSVTTPLIALFATMIILGWGLLKGWNNLWNSDASKSKKRAAIAGPHGRALRIEAAVSQNATNFAAAGLPTPLIHKFSTYVYGDPHFDESFSIENAAGEYFGECGVTPTGTLPNSPDHKTGLEIWLFDKTDASVANQIFASEHAYHNTPLRAQLANQGPVLGVGPATIIRLETKQLRLQARVLDMQYGFSDKLPPHSFFDYLVVEIAVWTR